jgi:hypothetical protein
MLLQQLTAPLGRLGLLAAVETNDVGKELDLLRRELAMRTSICRKIGRASMNRT